jgi:hypothetical protein
MAARSDHLSKRLFESLRGARAAFATVTQFLDEQSAKMESEMTWTESQNALLGMDMSFGLLARAALRINPDDPNDQPLAAAFEVSGLDPKDPLAWRTLLGCFAEVHFGKSSAGRPMEWGGMQLEELYTDFQEVKSRHRSVRSDKRICELMRTRPPYKEKYQKYSVETLRKAVRRAADPEQNIFRRDDQDQPKDLVGKLVRLEMENYKLPEPLVTFAVKQSLLKWIESPKAIAGMREYVEGMGHNWSAEIEESVKQRVKEQIFPSAKTK